MRILAEFFILLALFFAVPAMLLTVFIVYPLHKISQLLVEISEIIAK
jgi:TRAP-type mannitol/chloroaromatic compound transport system permease small subunit